MKPEIRKLALKQLSQKISTLRPLKEVSMPPDGWVFSIRNALKISLKQLGTRIGISPQSLKEMEKREKLGTVTLKTMKEIAKGLNMHFYYALIPEEDSLEKMIEKRAFQLAEEIVRRTSITMKLEDQSVSDEHLRNAIQEKAEEIRKEMPRYLWD